MDSPLVHSTIGYVLGWVQILGANDSMAEDDKPDEIEQTRMQEQRLTVAAKREAAEKRRQIRIFSEKAKQIKKAKDARAYGELLRGAKIREGSPE